MARPIEATPTLTGEDAARLLSDLKQVCSAQESARRISVAKQGLLDMMSPKHTPINEPGKRRPESR